MSVSISSLRLAVQHVSFVVLTFGGHFNIFLGSSLPCLSCPFVGSCGGGCYLMAWQRAMSWLFPPLVEALTGVGSWARAWSTLNFFLSGFVVFALLVIVLGKSWCGWVCPFGVVQDYLARLRRLLGLREAEMSERVKAGVSNVKYVLLAYLTLMPVLYSFGWLSRDFVLSFCNICPAKIIMPLATLDYNRLGLPVLSSSPRAVFALILLAVTGGMVAAMFFKDRFFCLVCPMLAMINIFRRLHLLRLVKDVGSCRGCGSCRRTCAMDNQTIYRERESARPHDPDCLGCFSCAEGCSTEGSLGVRLGPLNLFGSTPVHAIGRLTGGKK
ncbi:MAG: 4Fe-4S binding protein [Deltaproteobacteria bacterium]|jgi:polyferredoxin|nr:4Fe-4S binding protein [Deltaproteobacteria bacterium]